MYDNRLTLANYGLYWQNCDNSKENKTEGAWHTKE